MSADLIQAHKAALASLAKAQERQRALEAQHGAAIEARRMATIIPDPLRPGGWCAGLGPHFIAGRIARSFESAVVYADEEERTAMAEAAQQHAPDVFALLDAHDAATGLPAALAATKVAREAEQAALAALAGARPSTSQARAYLADAPTLALAAARAALRDCASS
jgi:hypothetical protein